MTTQMNRDRAALRTAIWELRERIDQIQRQRQVPTRPEIPLEAVFMPGFWMGAATAFALHFVPFGFQPTRPP